MEKNYKERINYVKEELIKIMEKYGTPITFITRKTGVHTSTLNLLVHNRLEYGISEKKLISLENFISERI